MTEPTAEERRAALVERVAEAAHAGWSINLGGGPAASWRLIPGISRRAWARSTEAVLALLASEGRLIEPGEVERLRGMLARFVGGRQCEAPKWDNATAGLGVCNECRTCLAALEAGLTAFSTGWCRP